MGAANLELISPEIVTVKTVPAMMLVVVTCTRVIVESWVFRLQVGAYSRLLIEQAS